MYVLFETSLMSLFSLQKLNNNNAEIVINVQLRKATLKNYTAGI